MSISKGSVWGRVGVLPQNARVATSNRHLSELIRAVPLDGTFIVGLAGGDLHRTVGGPSVPGRLHTADAMLLPIDVIEAELDHDTNRRIRFVTHLIAHDRFYRNGVAAMNADFWRRYQLGPRAHPGDGVLDVYQATLEWGDIVRIAPRARTGTHVPHPRLLLQRGATAEVTFARRLRVVADDVYVGRATSITFRVIPDAITIVV